jgi:hypothetical protein
MYCTRALIICSLLLGNILLAQDRFALLSEPTFAVNTEVSYKYQMNFSLRSRHLLYQGSGLSFATRQVDLAHFSTFKLDLRHSFSFGLQYRNRSAFEDLGNEFRLTQQFNIIRRSGANRFGHRIRTEQRFFEKFTVHRIRYRFAWDRPLHGPSLDVGESYTIQSIEAVSSYSKALSSTYDIRLNSQIGWLFTRYLRLQVGLEYRLNSINQVLVHRLFLLCSAILKV